MPLNKKKILRNTIEVCRIILALTFIFSGFVKSVDPWGTGLKVGEYLAAFDMDWLYGWRFGIGIWLNGAELMLGLMVLFKIRLRLTSMFISAAMLFFTVLTLVLAIWDPVEDCGCFGEAVKLTNWQTFIKNLILLPMALIVCWKARKLPIRPTWSDGFFMVLFGTIAFGIGVYSYMHLPIIDFLPYKKGTDLVAAMNTPGTEDIETIVIYRDRQTGKEHKFELSDTTWYDESRWEFVDTEIIAIHNAVHPTIRDFAIFNDTGVVTDEIIGHPGVVYMIFASELSRINPGCESRLEAAASQASARGYKVICVTADPLRLYPSVHLGNEIVQCYNMDATTMKTVLRAMVGVVVLRNGVIVDKINCYDLSDKDELPQY